MPVVRRTRTRVVEETAAPASRSSLALRRRRGETDEEIPAKGRRSIRAARHEDDQDDQVVSAPNTDYPMGEVIDRARFDMRPARPGDHLHVSDLLHKCIRKKAIENRFGVVPAQQRLSMSDMLTFAMGDAVHDTIKDRARIGSPEKVWGKWSCKCEYLMHDEPCVFADIDQEETCPHCKSLVNKYHEVSMFDEEYGIVGNPDLVLYFERKDAFHVVEVKSIAHKAWEELARPDPMHVLQVVFYWHLMHRKGYKLTDRCSIFYVTKQWHFGDKPVYKEFLIDPVAALDRIMPYIEDAKAYKAALESEDAALPLRTVCSHVAAKDAKKCGVLDICFGG
jgi:hypothetical protein